MVKNLQQKLKKEMKMRKEIFKQLKQSNQEIGNLKTYINKLEKELNQFKIQTKKISKFKNKKLV